MLIQTALDLLSADLQALAWVEFFGGVVRRIDRPITTESGTTYKSYPVSCNVSEVDCNKNQRYQDLTPNSAKKSILYWEVLQAFTDTGNVQGNEKKRMLRGRARLVGWLNAAKLGLSECNSAGKAVRSLIPLINKSFRGFVNTSEFFNSTVKFEFSGEEIKDSAIFSRYDYAENKDGFLLYPYDFFALNVNISCTLPMCDFDFQTNAVIDCPTDQP